MKNITKNEMNALIILFKEISNNYNANNLSKELGISSMGTLKILKDLERKDILKSAQFGKAVFYKLNFNNDYVNAYLKFLLQNEAEQSIPRVRKWVKEIRKLKKDAEIGILFGSVLKTDNYKDIDLLLVLKESQNNKIKKLIDDLNKINIKKIHIIRQTKKDLEQNLNKEDEVIINIIKKGIILFGYDSIIEIIKNVTCKK